MPSDALTPQSALAALEEWASEETTPKQAAPLATAHAFVYALCDADPQSVATKLAELRYTRGFKQIADGLSRALDNHRKTLQQSNGHGEAEPDWCPQSDDEEAVFARMDKVGAIDPRPRPVTRNAVIVLQEDEYWRERVAYNTFASVTELDETPLTDGGALVFADDIAERYRLHLSKQQAVNAIQTVALSHTHNPVEAYLRSCEWDGKPRIDNWLSDYCDAAPTTLTPIYSRKFLISAVARALAPGCKVDTMLLFVDEKQGTRKSTAVASLVPEPAWFSDAKLNIGDKDALLALGDKWIMEMPEMSSTRKKDVEDVKHFLSQRVNVYRRPYDMLESREPRHTVFVGTTNNTQPLTDSENRRFWPVMTGELDPDAIARDRDQLWAEAVRAYDAGEQWWLTPDEEQEHGHDVAGFQASDLIADAIREWAEMSPQASLGLTLRELWAQVGLDALGVRATQSQRIAAAARGAGMRRDRTSGRSLWKAC